MDVARVGGISPKLLSLHDAYADAVVGTSRLGIQLLAGAPAVPTLQPCSAMPSFGEPDASPAPDARARAAMVPLRGVAFL